MIPRNWWNMENIKEDKKWSSLTLFLKDIYNILNKGLVFKDNFKGSVIRVSFTAANADTTIRHGLAFVPTSYLVLNSSVALSVYDGSQTSDIDNIFLKSTAIGQADLFIF